MYCEDDTQKVASQIPIAQIRTLALRSVAYCLVRMFGTTTQHIISHPLMYYALEYMRPTIYDWCTDMLASIHTQLTAYKTGRQKNFGYGSLICSLFFERIPTLNPRVSLSSPPPRQPWMMRWTRLWYRLGGGPTCHYDEDFFNWWARVTFCVDEYCYTGMDYRGDPNLPLPADARWGDIGMILAFVFSHIYDFFFVVCKFN